MIDSDLEGKNEGNDDVDGDVEDKEYDEDALELYEHGCCENSQQDTVFDVRLTSQSHQAGASSWKHGRLGNITFPFQQIKQVLYFFTRHLQDISQWVKNNCTIMTIIPSKIFISVGEI